MPRQPPPRFPFTDWDKRRIRALSNVNHSMSGHKRFARDMNYILTSQPELGITIGQRYYLDGLVSHYHKQLPFYMVPIECASEDNYAEHLEETMAFEADAAIHYSHFQTPDDLAEMRDYKAFGVKHHPMPPQAQSSQEELF
jgi:hypothetical protein